MTKPNPEKEMKCDDMLVMERGIGLLKEREIAAGELGEA